MNALQFGFGRSLPMVHQTETAECGTACLAMISSYYGHHFDMTQMRAKLQTSIKGTTLKELVRFADELDLASRAVRLEMEDLPQLQMPCILHWDMDHYVVLKSANAHRIVIHDPGYGVRKMRLQEASKHFTGAALELSPTPSFEEKKAEKSISLKTLLGNAVGLKRALFQILSLSLILETLSLGAPLFQQWVLDSVVIHNDVDLLKVLSLGFFMLLLLQLCISTLRNWMVIYFSTQINIQWASGVLTKLLRLPMDYFGRRHLGDVMSRFGSIQAIRQTLTSAALNALLDGLMACFAFIMMWIYSPKLALITLGALSLYLIVRISSYPAFLAVSEEQIIHSARQESNLLETVRGVQSIKLFNRQNDRRNQWLNLLINTTNRELASQRLSTLFQVANTLIFGIENILVVCVGAVLIMGNEMSIGMTFAYGAYKMQFSSRISALVDLFFQFRMLTIQRERLADIVLAESEPQGGNGMPEPGIPSIELRHIRFRYASSEPWVLDGVSLKIDAGETVAIVGPSGCGKTTLLKIMLGLLQPTEGEILIMGQALSSIGLSAWRDTLGAVMQEDQLFAGTIAENIAFFAPQIDYGRVHECATIAAIDQDILGMPLTWQTLIGDMGTALSGGQKQRILLARALYKEPRILFLDEATSHLDVEREQSVNKTIRALSITKVVIAHRQETINMADRIITIQKEHH